MKKVLSAGAALLLTTSIAQAGGIDRSGNAYSVLFEDGNYVQLSYSSVSPEVSGEYPGGTGSTGNMAESYSSAGLALKYGISEQLDLALFINQPFGANADYGIGFYDGLSATWDSTQVAAIAKYQVSSNISVYGGLRAVESKAVIAIPDGLIRAGIAAGVEANVPSAVPRPVPTTGPIFESFPEPLQNAILAATSPPGALEYSAETESNTQFGYVIGAAYERPDIALRVSLTYESGMTHDFKTRETLPAAMASNAGSTTDIEMPQSLALDFQTGVAADTLVFGSVRWSEWSVWEVRPTVYESVTGNAVTGIDNDVFTYRLGVGRRISDELSVFGRVTFEDGNGGVASRLSPTDGSTSYGIGGTYTMDNVKLTGGIEYAILGDATDGTPVEFADNTALGFGLSIGYSF